MAFALNSAYNECLHTLISADMAPSIGKISPEYVSPRYAFSFVTDPAFSVFATLSPGVIPIRLTIFRGNRFASYAKGMQEIEDSNVRTKAEGDKVLQGYEKVGLPHLLPFSLASFCPCSQNKRTN
jgi:hypothetical protein